MLLFERLFKLVFDTIAGIAILCQHGMLKHLSNCGSAGASPSRFEHRLFVFDDNPPPQGTMFFEIVLDQLNDVGVIGGFAGSLFNIVVPTVVE